MSGKQFNSKWKRRIPDSSKPPPLPPSWQSWFRLYQIAPTLRKLHESWVRQKPPPRPMSDEALLALAACFADPERRETLRALILDLLSPDLIEMIQYAIDQELKS